MKSLLHEVKNPLTTADPRQRHSQPGPCLVTKGQASNVFTTNPSLKLKLRSVATILGKPEPLCPSQESCWLDSQESHEDIGGKVQGFPLLETLLPSPTAHPMGGRWGVGEPLLE